MKATTKTRKKQGAGAARQMLLHPNRAARSGSPLDHATRASMEARFGHDFGTVRVHTDSGAADSARQMGAAAYTTGRDIVFGAEQYQPDTEPGRALLAHELTHVVQQGSGIPGAPEHLLASGRSAEGAEREADLGAHLVSAGQTFRPATRTGPAVHCADEEWNKAYGKHKSFLQLSFEDYKKGLGEIKETTAGGLTKNEGRPIKKKAGAGTPTSSKITIEILKEIYPGLAADVAKDKDKEDKAKRYADHLNQAFDAMKINTVEAQAVYLAHAFIESDQFRQFTETQGSSAVQEGKQKWMDKPEDIQLDENDLRGRYKQGGTVNPGGKFEFIGRGPVQVTHKHEYVEVIAMLEKAAEQYDAAPASDTKAAANAKLCREAAKAIKADPRQAANPKYTFLVSAAVMKKQGADVSAAGVHPGDAWTGTDAASGWVAGGKQKEGSPQAIALGEKQKAYERIYKVLMREAKANSTAAKAETATP